jgi:hypothetical protein
MYTIGLQVLRAKLRGFQAAGTTISSRISKSEKERKHALWNAKRELGVHCRHHLIAYGLIRGLSYAHIEKCAPNNKPDPKYVLRLMQDHDGTKWTLEKIETLLMSPVPTLQSTSTTSSQSLSSKIAERLFGSLGRRLEKRS